MKRKFLIVLVITFAGCVSVPDGVKTVDGFELNRFLGKWYEIARFDHSFERGLEKVTAEYSMRDDGGVKVLNRGFNPVRKQWSEAEGRAYFAGDSKKGELKVSFFGPFFGAYNIIDLDKAGYTYMLVCGHDRSYLWILARSPKPDREIVDRLVLKAALLGFDTSKLIFVKQE